MIRLESISKQNGQQIVFIEASAALQKLGPRVRRRSRRADIGGAEAAAYHDGIKTFLIFG